MSRQKAITTSGGRSICWAIRTSAPVQFSRLMKCSPGVDRVAFFRSKDRAEVNIGTPESVECPSRCQNYSKFLRRETCHTDFFFGNSSLNEVALQRRKWG